MKSITLLLALIVAGCGCAREAPPTINFTTPGRMLVIDPSSMPVAAGKVTLIIGPLARTNGVYTGDYRIKVFPYFFKNEKGRLAIIVSDQSLAGINQGKFTAITGTATTNGKGGHTRPIEATATPTDINHGTLKLWFTTAGSRKMIFEPAYHFTGKTPVAVPPPLAKTNPAAIHL